MPHLLFAYANDFQDRSRYLRGLSAERQAISEAMKMPKNMGLCQTVEVYDATVERIVDAFQAYNGEIALFHFGGHAGSFDLLLQDQVAGGEGLISFLGSRNGLQVVFLNGCHTRLLAGGLIEAGVPVVIGTDEAIIDSIATNLSKRFYQGLGVGLSVQRAFQDAVEEQRMSVQGGNIIHYYRSLVFEEEEGDERPRDFPWRLHVAAGKEDSLEWSLARENPLLGLPDPPNDIPLPEAPYLFFQRYERSHAHVFFGRARHIRLLYERIVNPDSPPLILLHGQSGCGKSSLFEAGLLPRMEADYQVAYLRRDEQGLAVNLTDFLDQDQGSDSLPEQKNTTADIEGLLDQLEQELKGQTQSLQYLRSLRQRGELRAENTPTPHSKWLQHWQEIEAQNDRPLLLVLDQAEESFTLQSKRKAEAEWQAFGEVLTALFGAGTHIQGKLILGFRKEYLPEVERHLKEWALPRSQVFLPTLTREEVSEIVQGLESRQALRERYNLRIEEGLPARIASDLLRDKEETVAPILQILLTNMWRKAQDIGPGYPHFDQDLYDKLKAQWWEMDQFVEAQIAKIATAHPEAVANGLLLDVLVEHCTPGGTAKSNQLTALQGRYAHIKHLTDLLDACHQHLLLRKHPDGYRLSHDTLAPVIRRMYQQSDRAGQRARRILEGRISSDQLAAPLDRYDLAQVQAGRTAMRSLMDQEEDLLLRSEEKEQKRQRQRTWVIASLLLLAMTALGAGILSYINKAKLVTTEQTVEQLQAQEDSLQQSISSKEQLISANQAQLDQQQDSIFQLQSTTEELTSEAATSAMRAQAAERRFVANQLAADALSYLQQGKKYEATQAVLSAYQQDKKSPAVWGALLKLAYDAQPIMLPYHSRYQGEQANPSPTTGQQIRIDTDGFSILDDQGNKLFNYQTDDFVLDVRFVKDYADRVYAEIGDEKHIIIWQGILPAPEIMIAGDIAGLAQTSHPKNILWAETNGRWGEAGTTTQRSSEQARIQGPIRSVAHSPDGQYVVLGKPSNFVVRRAGDQAFDLQLETQDPSLEFRVLRFSPKGTYLLAARTQGRASLYRWQSGQQMEMIMFSPQEQTDRFLVDLCMDPTERFLFSIDNGKTLHLWDHQNKRLLDSQVFSTDLNRIILAPNGRLLIAGANGQVFGQRSRQGQLTAKAIPAFRQVAGVVDIAFSGRSQPLIAIAAGTQVQLFDWQREIPIWQLSTSHQIRSIAFSPDGHYLWIGTAKGLLSPVLIDPSQLFSRISHKNILNPDT